MPQQVDRQIWHEVMVPNRQPGTLIPVRGNSSRLFDQQGGDYIDLTDGNGANLLGHCHPALVETLCTQARTLWQLHHDWTHEPALRLAQQLCAATFADRVQFGTTGTDANETALQLALHCSQLHHAEKHHLVAFQGGHHGHSLFTEALSDHPGSGVPAPHLPITRLPFNEPDALHSAINHQTAAVIVEPIQTACEIRAASPEFLHTLRECCDRHAVPLIFDEVQTGMGRTGQLFAYMHSGVIPDMLTCAHALAGGFPLSAVLTHRHFSDHCPQPDPPRGNTASPLVCRVASRILERVSEPALLRGVQARHQLLRNTLSTLNQQAGSLQAVSGEGLLMCTTLAPPWQGRAMDVARLAEQHGVLVATCGDNVIGFSPSLVIDPQDLIQGLNRFAAALTRPS